MMFERTIPSVWMMPVSTAASLDFRKLKPVQVIMIFLWKTWSVMIGKIVFN